MENQPLNYPAFSKAADAFKEVDGTTLFDHLADKKPEEAGEIKPITRESLTASVIADEVFAKLPKVNQDLITGLIGVVTDDQLALASVVICVGLHGTEDQKEVQRKLIFERGNKLDACEKDAMLTILSGLTTDAPKAGT